MTHLNRDSQITWIEEIKRITAIKGIFLASVHGKFATYFAFPDTYKSILENGIFDEIEDNNLLGIVPSGYYS